MRFLNKDKGFVERNETKVSFLEVKLKSTITGMKNSLKELNSRFAGQKKSSNLKIGQLKLLNLKSRDRDQNVQKSE